MTNASLQACSSGENRCVTWQSDARMLGYWITLGAAAGALGGFLVGGVGGRLGMFLLRITSDKSVNGLLSDDGFVIGRFDVLATMQLLLVTTVMGAIVGLIVTFGRPFFPGRWMPIAWGTAGLLLGGGMLVHQDGVDFTALSPRLLAILLFMAIPGAGALAIALLVERYQRFWWTNRRATMLMSIPILPCMVFFPLPLLTLLIAGLYLLALRVARIRLLPSRLPVRIAAASVFALLVALGTIDLVGDASALL